MITPFELGKEFDFYGVDNCRFKLDSQIFEALEDQEDGYRSYLGSVEVAADSGDVFHQQPLDVVRVVEFTTPDHYHTEDGYNDFAGYAVESVKDGHRWLVFGTDDISDYYPGFVFHYSPRAPDANALAVARSDLTTARERVRVLEEALRLAEPVLNTAPHPTGCKWLKGGGCNCGIDAALSALATTPREP